MTAAPPTVSLAYGRGAIDVPLQDGALVITPQDDPALPDPATSLRDALRDPLGVPPLREQVRPGMTVAISVCDGTRAQPRRPVLHALLEEIDAAAPGCEVVVLVATGTHRGNTAEELREMLGDDVLARCSVVNHDARDRSSLTHLGTAGDGVPLELNTLWVEADLRITTGFVEPHFFAGFSGGPKLAVPGLAGLETVLTLHDAERIGSPRAVWGVCEGNPVHDDIRAVVAAVGGVHFGFDVTLNREQQVVGAFAGELFAMHAAAREAARELAMAPVPERFDVVVTTNSGFPLDQNLYQAVKGISAAATVVEDGGAIICAAECRDGFPNHGSYREVLESAESPQALLDLIESRPKTVPDQWQVQVQAKIQSRARVGVHSSYLSGEDLRAAHLEPVEDIADAVGRELAAVGGGGRVCVLPEGPQTIPYVV